LESQSGGYSGSQDGDFGVVVVVWRIGFRGWEGEWEASGGCGGGTHGGLL